MENSLEESLYQAILLEDQDSVSHILLQGANPNKLSKHGKTCLGEASYRGNSSIVKLLVDAGQVTNTVNKSAPVGGSRKRLKSNKRKLRSDRYDESYVKCKLPSDRNGKNCQKGLCEGFRPVKTDSSVNHGYFVYIHSEGSSSDESKICSLQSPPSLLTPSPVDLEWDEELGSIAPTTTEDEAWSSIYKWYAAILESTGAAIASASALTNGIDQQDSFMRTALHYAVEQGYIDIVKLLIGAGCRVDVAAGDGLTALHFAVVKNHSDIVKILISAGSYVNYKTHEKMTALHFASSRGFLDIVKVLIQNGAYLEARDTSERTALYLAAARGNADVVLYLIQAGANVNSEEIHGYTPLCEAVWQRYTDIVDILLSAGARVVHSHKLLHNAILQRQEDIVELLASNGGGLNLHNDNGDTPLLLAIRLRQPNVVQTLLQNGANVNSCNNLTGATALHVAVESTECSEQFEEMLICLLEFNIDMNCTALTGDTALSRALLLRRDYAAVLLIRHGADVNACDLNSCGVDNLTIACGRQSNALASMLLQAGHSTMFLDITIKPKPGSISNWVYHACKTPLKLSDICRLKIRHMHRNTSLSNFVSSLPLPKSLKMFLMMENEGIEII